MEEIREGKVIGRKGGALKVECPACGDIVKGRGTKRGRIMKCPVCRSKFLIPGPKKQLVRMKKRKLLPKVPVVRAEKFYHCFWCKEPVEYTTLKCPHCREPHRLKLEPMLSKAWGLLAVDFIIALCSGIFAALMLERSMPGANWVWIASSIAGVVVCYFAISYGVFGRTLMEWTFGVIVVDRNCRRIGVFKGVGRAFFFILFLVPLLFGPAVSALSASTIASGVSMPDKIFGTYMLKKQSLKAYLSLEQVRRAEFEEARLEPDSK